ncbi:MAG TPA: hypothetical protein VMJ66_08275 [Geobacteraceae bacterium]|nr:hypothetical protein [Geobacteraceae bacterium]
MTDEQLIDLAKSKVPAQLHKTATIVKHGDRLMPSLAASRKAGAPESFDEAMAAELGKPLPPSAGKDSADVVFHEKGRLGRRSTVVQIRNGKVANILRRG